ncbi:MAG: universal stress protein [Nitrososphaeraceae archaeon]
MIAKILVPHDGTEMSNRAFEKATEFANAPDTEIILLHVIQDVPVPSSLLLGNDRILISRAKRSIAKELEKGWNKMVQEKIIGKVSKDKKIKIRSDVIVGSPAEEIIRFANANKIDMIILGSRGLETISKIKALGSVARKVSEAAKCPVMIIH